MVPFKPHHVSIASAKQVKDSRGVVLGYNFVGAFLADCMFDPERALAVFNAYGVQLKRPYRLFIDIEDARDFTGRDRLAVGARLYRDNGQVFAVATPLEYFEFGLENDHATCIVDLLQYADKDNHNV